MQLPLPVGPVIGLLLLAPAGAMFGQAAPAGCTALPYRAFDFWVGEWTVTNPAGQEVGSNSITTQEGGCLLREQWTDKRGGTGQSINYYDPEDERWHQIWIDPSGRPLKLTAPVEQVRMAFTGKNLTGQGAWQHHKLTFTLNTDGSVRQLWESSTDSGTTWNRVFDGLYRKRQ